MRKRITANNPQGVKYSEANLADGSIVYAYKIDKSQAVWKGIRFYFLGCEGDDEEEMVFVQRRKGNGFTKYFRHRPGYIKARNETDRYLHNYSELRIKQRFDDSAESGEFLIKYYEEDICPNCKTCKLAKNLNCEASGKARIKTINLRDMYDTCTPEKSEDKYIADLLLTNSKDDTIKPLFLEIYVTHKCSEEKINSGYEIVEIKIKKKEDAECDIIENMGDVVNRYNFMSYANEVLPPPIWFHGFTRDASFNNYVQLAVFFLIENGDGSYKGVSKQMDCIEFNDMPTNKFGLCYCRPLKEISCEDLYEFGIAKTYNENYNVRDCSICTKRHQCKDRCKIDNSLGCLLFEVDINHVTRIIESREARWIELDKSNI
jgi:hypothetical protein